MRVSATSRGSYDAVSGSLDGPGCVPGCVPGFFTRPHFAALILNPGTGEVVRG